MRAALAVGAVLVRSFATLEWVDRHPGTIIASIGIALAAAYLSATLLFPHAHRRIVNGDAIQYYSYLRSLAIDRDVDFTNEYQALYLPVDGESGNVWLNRKTPIGRPVNMMSIGPAILWTPFFLAVWIAIAALQPLGMMLPLDGFATPFQVSAGVAGVTYATLGAYFCYRSCRVIFETGPAFWATLVAWLATPAIYYSVISPAYSHATSFFATSLFCWIWLTTRGQQHVSRYVWLGILAGLAALVRWQDVIVLVLPAFELADSISKRRISPGAAVLRACLVLTGTVVMLLPQLLAWRAMYGTMFVIPQGGGFMQWTRPAILSVLFSLRHGLFTWTPAVLLAVAGLFLLVRRDKLLGLGALVVIALAVYVNASASDWWAGAAFGARRFVGYTVFFAFGFAALFSEAQWQRHAALLRWTAMAVVAYNLLFVFQYQMFMRGFEQLVPYPTTVRQVLFDRLTLPWRLVQTWLDR